jgi:hypothetical protein
MPGLVRRISIWPALLAFVACFGLGCAHSVVVDIDEQEDFSRYQSWDWMPQVNRKVIAPYGSASALDARVAELIETSLSKQGLERTSDHPDFYLTYLLIVTRHAEVVQQAVAPYLLSSLDSSPSYLIEGSVAEVRRYDQYRLAIGVSHGPGRMTWRGAVAGRVAIEDELPLDDAIATLFERFPPYDLVEAARQ